MDYINCSGPCATQNELDGHAKFYTQAQASTEEAEENLIHGRIWY